MLFGAQGEKGRVRKWRRDLTVPSEHVWVGSSLRQRVIYALEKSGEGRKQGLKLCELAPPTFLTWNLYLLTKHLTLRKKG